eukprot:TRINITY_DN2266_c0_g1_i1.p1 TRINITY_DN2266_c0_g1~~TRINITY_DN2266_c0_g1_i1.p1  ORF type:complete len:458 (+),score=67.41 TRINITY_DN2266_c0_g1_i1:66-1439(+)
MKTANTRKFLDRTKTTYTQGHLQNSHEEEEETIQRKEIPVESVDDIINQTEQLLASEFLDIKKILEPYHHTKSKTVSFVPIASESESNKSPETLEMTVNKLQNSLSSLTQRLSDKCERSTSSGRTDLRSSHKGNSLVTIQAKEISDLVQQIAELQRRNLDLIREKEESTRNFVLKIQEKEAENRRLRVQLAAANERISVLTSTSEDKEHEWRILAAFKDRRRRHRHRDHMLSSPKDLPRKTPSSDSLDSSSSTSSKLSSPPAASSHQNSPRNIQRTQTSYEDYESDDGSAIPEIISHIDSLSVFRERLSYDRSSITLSDDEGFEAAVGPYSINNDELPISISSKPKERKNQKSGGNLSGLRAINYKSKRSSAFNKLPRHLSSIAESQKKKSKRRKSSSQTHKLLTDEREENAVSNPEVHYVLHSPKVQVVKKKGRRLSYSKHGKDEVLYSPLKSSLY